MYKNRSRLAAIQNMWTWKGGGTAGSTKITECPALLWWDFREEGHAAYELFLHV